MEWFDKGHRVVKSYFAHDGIAYALVTFDSGQLIAPFDQWPHPCSDLIGVHDKRIAIPKTDRLAMPFRKLHLFGRMSAAVGIDPANKILGIGVANDPHLMRKENELFGGA